MTTFWIIIALILLSSLVIIWLPHIRQAQRNQSEESNVRHKTNVELFNERLAILDKELIDGLLDQTEFNALKKELEVSLLQDTKQGQDESLTQSEAPKSPLVPALMSAVVIGVSAYAYYDLGAPEAITFIEKQREMQLGSSGHGSMTPEQMMSQQVAMMEAQTEAQPDNSQAWFNLGHAYMSANRYDDSAAAFDKVMDIVGVQAELLGPKATALYYKHNQTITPEIQGLIDQSLAMDPVDPSTLLLVGMDSFFNANYETAIAAWEKLLTNPRQDIDRQSVTDAIAAAQMRLSMTNGEMPADHAQMMNDAEPKNIKVHVEVAPELQDKVGATDMLFVFARTIDGSNIPLAATKLGAKGIPGSLMLDDSTGMGGSMKLSQADYVEIIAVLSKHGSVRPQSGDLQGRLDKVAVGGEVTIILDQLVD